MNFRIILFSLVFLLLSSGNALGKGVVDTNAVDLLNRIAMEKGKVVVVNFWATWCGPCRKEIPELIKLRKVYGDKELAIIGVSLDENRGLVNSFIEQFKVNYTILRGDQGAADLFKANKIPTLLFYGKDGRLVTSSQGAMPEKELKKLVAGLSAQAQ
jgi:thiol-disulfide isomerase/thioredoxin